MINEPNNKTKDFDLFDGISVVSGAIVIASVITAGGSLVVGFPVALMYFLQHAGRRTKRFEGWIDHISGHNVVADTLARNLLPPPKDDNISSITLRDTRPMSIDSGDRTLFQRMTNPAIGEDTSILTGVIERNTLAKQQQNLVAAIKRLPKYISYKDLPASPANMAVPIGYDSATKQFLWADFGNQLDNKILHAIVAGYTGSGKDALLRLWFSMLTTHNTPEELQFVVVDGKVDWLSPALAESAYMAIPPSGGVDIQRVDNKFVDCAKEHMANSFIWMFEEVQRRQNLFSQIGAIDMTSYTRKTGKKLPYLFFIASDVGETFDGDLKMLVNLLIMKGRAYGVRLIISLQNPVGESTKWRSQVGLIMTGHQPIPDHDRYVLGINVDRMLYRPSLLPNPEETELARGLFIVRRGSTQHLVKTPHLPESDWEDYIEQVMKTRRAYKEEIETNLLDNLLSAPLKSTGITKPMQTPKMYATRQLEAPKVDKPTKALLAKDQVTAVIDSAMHGVSKTEIMINVLKITNGDRYKEVSPIVDLLIKKVKEKMQ